MNMLKSGKNIWLLFVGCIISCVATISVSAATDEVLFYTYADDRLPETKIQALVADEFYAMILPATASTEKVKLYWNDDQQLKISGASGEKLITSGDEINLNSLCDKNNYVLTFYDADKNKQGTLKFLFNSEIPSVYLMSEDSENKGREWVEADYKKSNKAKGSMLMQKINGEVVFSGGLTQIKGRGNTTWGLDKKPYQIKLENKADLLETNNDENKSKTWILLANYLDPSGIRNTIALNIGEALKMPVNIQGKSVNLYYDGEYRGVYMLTEKVEVGSGRVDISDLEEENAKANEGVDLETLPVKKATTENGAEYTFCEGMKSPENITGGYLIEMDYEERALEEICYFKTTRNQYVVVKSPEYASKEEMNYIATLYQEYEDSVYAGGINPETGKKFSDYVDVRSVACYFLVNEFSKARDCFQSSAYLHKDSGDDKLHMGPLWDYDMSLGKGSLYSYEEDDSPLGTATLGVNMCKKLLKIDEFYTLAKDIYINEFAPLVRDVLLGDVKAVSTNGALKSFEYYNKQIATSSDSNGLVWYNGKKSEEEVQKLKNFIIEREKALTGYFVNFTNILDVQGNYFFDVEAEDWFCESVMNALTKGLMKGAGDGLFKPYDKVTRAQAVQTVYNIAGTPSVPFEKVFNDVSENDWFANAIVWATKNNVIESSEKNIFNQGENVKRQEVAELLYRYAGSPKVEHKFANSFNDYNKVTKIDAIQWAVKEGLIKGSENNINPTSDITRAELAAILMRFTE